MKNQLKIASLAVLALFLTATAVFSAGTAPWFTGKPATQIQNLKAPAYKPAQSRCDIVGSTTAVQKQYSTSGYVGVYGQAYNPNTGAAKIVKWSINGKQVAVKSEFEGVNDSGTAYSTLKAAAFTDHTTAFCVNRQ